MTYLDGDAGVVGSSGLYWGGGVRYGRMSGNRNNRDSLGINTKRKGIPLMRW
jgi:hypothetical protein